MNNGRRYAEDSVVMHWVLTPKKESDVAVLCAPCASARDSF